MEYYSGFLPRMYIKLRLRCKYVCLSVSFSVGISFQKTWNFISKDL